jgi:hypothetical protein
MCYFYQQISVKEDYHAQMTDCGLEFKLQMEGFKSELEHP